MHNINTTTTSSGTMKQPCTKCRKRRGVIVEMCKCSKYFCLECLPYFSHNCTFDWLGRSRNHLRESIPLVVGNKLPDMI